MRIEVLKIGILKNYLRMKFLKIKFENYLKTEVSIIKFENWNFGKLFENRYFGELVENLSFEN